MVSLSDESGFDLLFPRVYVVLGLCRLAFSRMMTKGKKASSLPVLVRKCQEVKSKPIMVTSMVGLMVTSPFFHSLS